MSVSTRSVLLPPLSLICPTVSHLARSSRFSPVTCAVASVCHGLPPIVSSSFNSRVIFFSYSASPGLLSSAHLTAVLVRKDNIKRGEEKKQKSNKQNKGAAVGQRVYAGTRTIARTAGADTQGVHAHRHGGGCVVPSLAAACRVLYCTTASRALRAERQLRRRRPYSAIHQGSRPSPHPHHHRHHPELLGGDAARFSLAAALAFFSTTAAAAQCNASPQRGAVLASEAAASASRGGASSVCVTARPVAGVVVVDACRHC